MARCPGRHLLPLPSDTYLQLVVGDRPGPGQHPLIKGFDANDRIRSAYANVDFPAGAYDEEPIDFVRGEHAPSRQPAAAQDPLRPDSVAPGRPTGQTTRASTVAGAIKQRRGRRDPGRSHRRALAAVHRPPGPIDPGARKMVTGKEAIFDAFMTMDANYENVPPARASA